MSEREMPATLAVHPQFPWMRASLDGWNAAERVVLEIKCPGKVDHELALEGKVPEKYYPQLQHQIFVANAERADYYSFDGERGICIQVKLNGEWFKDYFLKAMAFWEMVQTDTPPELVLRDWTSIRSKQLRLDLEAWHSASLVNDEHAEYLLNQMIAVHELENRRIRCSGFLVNGISRSITIGFPQQMQQQSPAVHQTI
jgi:predicted phage-related endonuclease